MWDDKQIKVFAKRLRNRVGGGWFWLTPEVRSALVSDEVVRVILTEGGESVSVAAVRSLTLRLLTACGLER